MFVRFISLVFISFFVLFGLISCGDNPTVPKPRTYPKLVFPEKDYVRYQDESCPYSFEVPAYADVEKDSLFFGEIAPNDCWINIYYKEFNGQLYCSYFPVSSEEELDSYIIDGYKIASKHTVKADFIDEYQIDRGPDMTGMAFEIEGPAASGFQFFLTDNEKHFFKASLYINAKVVPDSLAPIIQFLKPDVYHMIETFEWK